MKIGVYIDVANLAMNGGFGMRYEVLRAFSCREGGEAVRLNAYISFDARRAETDPEYKIRQYRFHSALRDLGYKVIRKDVKWYRNEDGGEVAKANVDLELAVDALLQSTNLDRVILVTGDGDFVQVVTALQNAGCRVEVLAFDNVSTELRRAADLYMSGYLVPGLLPIIRQDAVQKWGDPDGWACGVFYIYEEQKGFGWLRYLNRIEGELWRTDTREEHSPYRTIFCHDSELPAGVNRDKLTNRNILFEFRIVAGTEAGKTKAVDLRPIRTRT